MEVMDGSNFEVKCKSSRGKPAATLRWLDGAGAEIKVTEEDGEKNIEEETEDISDSKIKNQVSTIKLEAKEKAYSTAAAEAAGLNRRLWLLEEEVSKSEEKMAKAVYTLTKESKRADQAVRKRQELENRGAIQ